jgi:hypothetical protein
MEILKQLTWSYEWKKNAWILTQQFVSPSWKCSCLQGALCQAVYSPKFDYWNGIPSLLPWFGSE